MQRLQSVGDAQMGQGARDVSSGNEAQEQIHQNADQTNHTLSVDGVKFEFGNDVMRKAVIMAIHMLG
jgi:hypothetical protein